MEKTSAMAHYELMNEIQLGFMISSNNKIEKMAEGKKATNQNVNRVFHLAKFIFIIIIEKFTIILRY
jgi:hypothetical protein